MTHDPNAAFRRKRGSDTVYSNSQLFKSDSLWPETDFSAGTFDIGEAAVKIAAEVTDNLILNNYSPDPMIFSITCTECGRHAKVFVAPDSQFNLSAEACENCGARHMHWELNGIEALTDLGEEETENLIIPEADDDNDFSESFLDDIPF